MRTTTFSSWPTYPLVFLVPDLAREQIRKEYLDPFGIPLDDVKLGALHHVPGKKKTPKKEMVQWIEEVLVPSLDEGTKYLVVADAEYFKTLTGASQADANLGYVMDCLYGPWKVLYVPNFRTVFRDPERIRAKIAQAMEALLSHVRGTYQEPGKSIIHFAAFPRTLDAIEMWLEKLLAMDCDLAIDTENFSLKHHEAGIGTISFAWNQHEGIAFPVDYVPIEGATAAPFGRQVRNEPVRELLRNFFRRYLKKQIYHNITYDAYILIFQLFMDDLLDQEGMLEGMEIMLRNWDCTQLITYLATNTCAGNELGLKPNSMEFTGNYAMEEIADITRIPLEDLLQYNLVDSLAAWFVKNKHEPTMISDQQQQIYEEIFKPAVVDIIQTQLTGLPVNYDRVKEVKVILDAIQEDAKGRMEQTMVVEQYNQILRRNYVEKRNSELKKKRITLECEETQKVTFNPNSHLQLQELLYEILKLPIIERTKSKNPSTKAKVIQALVNHANTEEEKTFLRALQEYSSVTTILQTFIPALEGAVQGPDGWYYVFGSFRLGGTVSGRLSSANPNLQNLPANVNMTIPDYILDLFPSLAPFIRKGKLNLGRLIKSCFQAPEGWILVGLDFDSLEDRISALTTKDPNKLRVYTDGYDGHCLRAFFYFRDEMPDIVDTVESINSIKEKYGDLRDQGKVPTFLKTYQGTWIGIMQQMGWSEEKAKMVSDNYDELYQASIKWVQARLNEAAQTGYVEGAFGLRLRTPLLAQTVRGNSLTPIEAEAESRTAGNFLGQSWCLLNSRAVSEFMHKVRQSQYALSIRPCAQIHDASYYLIRDDSLVLTFVNTHLVEATRWQDHPVIAHDQVHLGGSLSVYWPTWAEEIELPNEASEDELIQIITKACT